MSVGGARAPAPAPRDPDPAGALSQGSEGWDGGRGGRCGDAAFRLDPRPHPTPFQPLPLTRLSPLAPLETAPRRARLSAPPVRWSSELEPPREYVGFLQDLRGVVTSQ